VLHQSFEGRRLSRRLLANGVETSFQRDSERLVSAMLHGLPGQLHFLALSFGRNETHDKTWSFDLTGHAIDRNFELDSAHRLTRSTESTGLVVQYALDAAGNREQVLGGPGSGSYSMTGADDELNQYTVTPIDARQYLPDGSLKSSGSATSLTNFAWTPLGELIVLDRQAAAGTVRLEYLHDGLGRRIQKLVKRNGVTTEIVRYYHDGDRVIAEESTLRGVRRLVPGDRGLDEVVQVKDLSNTYWLHGDDQLSVMAVTDDTGAVIERYEYGDYGERRIFDESGGVPRAISSIDLEIAFSGGRLDDESGLYHLRARYLDPTVGRFISRDPLGMWGDAVSLGNGMQYAGANPWTWSDPSGLKAIDGSGNPGLTPRYWWDPPWKREEMLPCFAEPEEGATNGPTDSESAERPEEKSEEKEGWLARTGRYLKGLFLGSDVATPVQDAMDTLKQPVPEADAELAEYSTELDFDVTRVSGEEINNGLADAPAHGAQAVADAAQAVEGGRALTSLGGIATGVLGSKRSPLRNATFQPLRNADGVIDGQAYAGHALDQMQNRGIMPSVVKNALERGVSSPDPIVGRLRSYDATNNITVITEGERVVTVVPGRLK
jgi:RHS repeat-associated protein